VLALAQVECQSSLMTPSQPDDERGAAVALGPWREVASGVFVAVAEPHTVNLGLILGSERCLLVDTGSTPAQGAAVRESVRTVTDLPLAGAVVTHGHHDHFFGLAAFDDLETVGHESLTERLTSPATAASARRLGFDVAELRGPRRPIVLAAGIDLGGRRVEVAHLGAGHTEGDVVVVVADADLLFTGDLIEPADAPWFDESSNPDEWATTLDSVIGLMTEHTQAVPGHGDPVDREFVFDTRGRVASVAGEIRRLAEGGVPLDQALAQGNWAIPADHVAPGLAAAYALLGPVQARRTLPLA